MKYPQPGKSTSFISPSINLSLTYPLEPAFAIAEVAAQLLCCPLEQRRESSDSAVASQCIGESGRGQYACVAHKPWAVVSCTRAKYDKVREASIPVIDFKWEESALRSRHQEAEPGGRARQQC